MSKVNAFRGSAVTQPSSAPKITPKVKLRHRPVIEVSLLDDKFLHISSSVLTVDQHGGYWIDRVRKITPAEVVEWYSTSMFDRGAVDVSYEDQEECHRIFGNVSALASSALKGGAK